MFCESLALFGSLFLGFFGYLVQNDMPYLKFKMVNKENTQNALYTSSLIYLAMFILLLIFKCMYPQVPTKYRVYQQWQYEINE